jgi:hypothetical protein
MGNGGDCLNCGTALDGRFCRGCGQDSTLALRPWRDLLAEWSDAVLGLETRTGRTLRALLFEPGRLTVEYAAGHRAAWIHPLRVYLGANVAALAVFGATSGRILARFQEALGPGGELGHMGAMLLAISAAFVVLVPAGGAIYALVFRDLRRFYAEHLVFNLHFTAYTFAVHAAASLLQYALVLVDAPTRAASAVRIAAHAATIVYLYLAARRCYGLSPGRTVLRLAVCSALAAPMMLAAIYATTGRLP